MTVGDLQKYLNGLATALEAGASPAAPDLKAAVKCLAPFAEHTVATFAQFLVLAWEYKTTGKVPESLPSKRPAAKKTEKKPKPPPPDAGSLIARVKELHDRALDPATTREGVEREVGELAKTTKLPVLGQVMAGIGFQKKFTTKGQVVKELTGYVMGRKGSYERSDA
jgi:hypothetical protein